MACCTATSKTMSGEVWLLECGLSHVTRGECCGDFARQELKMKPADRTHTFAHVVTRYPHGPRMYGGTQDMMNSTNTLSAYS